MKLLTTLLFFAFALSLPPLNAQELPKVTYLAPPEFGDPAEVTLADIPPAEISFEAQAFDFDTVTEGEIVHHVFTFTNTGTEPLFIVDAKGSCGCTVPAKPSAPIAPGETASITVQFNTRNKKGMRNQKVTIIANTQPLQTYLYLTGKVEPSSESDADDKQEELRITPAEDKAVPKDCFAIYPNPTAEVLKLKVDKENLGKAIEVAIYSMDGQLMARRKVEAIVGDVEFDVSHYPAGTYHARVAVAGGKPTSQCFVVVE
jgi:hypothetical protein